MAGPSYADLQAFVKELTARNEGLIETTRLLEGEVSGTEATLDQVYGELEASEKKRRKSNDPLAVPVLDAPRGSRGLIVQQQRIARARFQQAQAVERSYAAQLKRVARHVGDIISAFAPRGIVRAPAALTKILKEYSELLTPWASAVAETMIARVDRKDSTAWEQQGKEMGRALRLEIQRTPVGREMRRVLAENVDLIKSLPTKAGERVHKLTVEALSQTSARADEIAKEIMRSGPVTQSRAKLIARTEVARTASLLTQTRAQHIGSEGYVWRTVGDEDVRLQHQKLEGKLVRWAQPPVAGTGKGGVPVHYHAGQGPNCRCYPEPVLPAIIK